MRSHDQNATGFHLILLFFTFPIVVRKYNKQHGVLGFWWTTGIHAGEKFVGQFVAEKR